MCVCLDRSAHPREVILFPSHEDVISKHSHTFTHLPKHGAKQVKHQRLLHMCTQIVTVTEMMTSCNKITWRIQTPPYILFPKLWNECIRHILIQGKNMLWAASYDETTANPFDIVIIIIQILNSDGVPPRLMGWWIDRSTQILTLWHICWNAWRYNHRNNTHPPIA